LSRKGDSYFFDSPELLSPDYVPRCSPWAVGQNITDLQACGSWLSPSWKKKISWAQKGIPVLTGHFCLCILVFLYFLAKVIADILNCVC
jgi:hypothetical protein